MQNDNIVAQYIYLLITREYRNTGENIYKVGRTTQENHKRFKDYPKDSVLLFQIICKDCKYIEKIIINKFKENFKQRKDIGIEYFEGDYEEMIEIIYSNVKQEPDNHEEIITGEEETKDTDDQEENKIKDDLLKKKLVEKISKTFPDCKNDESFGGNKKYIKIYETYGHYYVDYINPNLMDVIDELTQSCHESRCQLLGLVEGDEDKDPLLAEMANYIKKEEEEEDDYDDDEDDGVEGGQTLSEADCDRFGPISLMSQFPEREEDILRDYKILGNYEIHYNVADELEYFKDLIKKKKIIVGKIYDINSIKFINKINKTKLNINIENYDDFQIHLTRIVSLPKIEEKITQLFHCAIIVNGSLYCTMEKKGSTYNILKKMKSLDKNIKDFDDFTILVGNEIYYRYIDLYKINSKYYTSLRENIPYVIRWDINKNYYIVNRDYKYIGLNCYDIDYEGEGSAHLFNDGNPPWNNRNNYIRLCNEYEKIINENSLNKCLNMNNSTKTILRGLD